MATHINKVNTICSLMSNGIDFIDLMGNFTFSKVGSPVFNAEGVNGGKALYLDGSSYLVSEKVPDLDIDDFTIDWFEKFVGGAATPGTFCIGTYSSYRNGICVEYYSGIYGFLGTTNRSTWNVNCQVYGSILKPNDFIHYAIVKQGNKITTYMNGVKVSSTTFTGKLGNFTTGAFTIGRDLRIDQFSVTAYSGYIASFRISNKALWTSDFTPPILPFFRAKQLYLDKNNAVWGCKP